MSTIKYVLNGTTNGSGDAVVDTNRDIVGEILAVHVDGHNLTDSANLTLTGVYQDVDGDELVGDVIVNHSDVGEATLVELHPRVEAQDPTGTVELYAATFGVVVPFAVAAPLRATISAGGATKAFRIWIIVRE